MLSVWAIELPLIHMSIMSRAQSLGVTRIQSRPRQRMIRGLWKSGKKVAIKYEHKSRMIQP